MSPQGFNYAPALISVAGRKMLSEPLDAMAAARKLLGGQAGGARIKKAADNTPEGQALAFTESYGSCAPRPCACRDAMRAAAPCAYARTQRWPRCVAGRAAHSLACPQVSTSLPALARGPAPPVHPKARCCVLRLRMAHLLPGNALRA